MDLDPIGSDIDTPTVRVSCNDAAGCPDLAAAILLVVNRDRKLQQIHIFATVDVFKDRAAGDNTRSDGLILSYPLPVGVKHRPPVT